MGFKVYVAGPLDYKKEREQMNDFIYALQREYGISDRHDVRLIVDIPRDPDNGCGKQIDGLLLKDDEIIILEIKARNGNVQVRFDPDLERRKREGELLHRIYYAAQPRWKVDGETDSQDQNPIDQATGQRYYLMKLIEDELNNVDGFDPKRKIRNWIVVKCKGITYETDEIRDYLQSDKPWLKIMQQSDFISEMNFLGEIREPFREDIPRMFEKVLGIVNAEERHYHRWLSERLLSEFYEVSRVPYLDYIIDSNDVGKIQDAIVTIERYRLRAYSEDLANIFYKISDAKVKDEALRVLINWEYEGLEDILVRALEGPKRSLYFNRALKHFSTENLFPATIPQLERILRDSYELLIHWETMNSINALKNTGAMEAGEILQRFLDSNFGENPCQAILDEFDRDADIIRTRYNGQIASIKKAEILSETIKGLGQCGDRGSLDYLIDIFRDFPYELYAQIERTMHSPSPRRQDFMYAMALKSSLGNILLSTVESIGELWDGRPLNPITNRFSIIHSNIVSDENKMHPLLELYNGILHCLTKIGDTSMISFLVDKLNEFPHPETGDPDFFWKPREEIVGTIAGIGGEDACRALINILREHKEIYRGSRREHEYHAYSGIIIDIMNHLGDLECEGAVGDIMTFLDEDRSDIVLIGEAVKILGRMKAEEAFDRMMEMFLDHQFGDYRALGNSLVSIDPKRCEERLLERFEDASQLHPLSWEASMLVTVATEDSIPLLFELAKDPEWYDYVLPKRIIDFIGNEDVVERLEAMLVSEEPHKRAFAIEIFSDSRHWGDRTDEELENHEDDESPLVRRMVLDIYAHRENLARTLRFLNDRDNEIRVHCYQKLTMFSRNEISDTIVASSNEWIDIHNVIITDGIIAFCKHYWLYDTDGEERIDDEMGVFHNRLEDVREVRHVTAILKIHDAPMLVELIYLEIGEGDTVRKLLLIPRYDEQFKGMVDFFDSYKLFADEMKKNCPNLRGGRMDPETIEGLFREILSAGFLGSGIPNDVEVKFRY